MITLEDVISEQESRQPKELGPEPRAMFDEELQRRGMPPLGQQKQDEGEPGLISQIGSRVGEVYGDVETALTSETATLPEKGMMAIGQSTINPLADIAGLVIASGAKKGFGYLPEGVKNGAQNIIKQIAESQPGQDIGVVAKDVSAVANWVKEKHPDQAVMLETVLNIPLLGAGKAALKEGSDIVGDVVRVSLPKQHIAPIGRKNWSILGVKPKGKSALNPESFYKKADNSVQTIIDLHKKGIVNKIPENTEEFVEAIQVAKRHIVKEYTDQAIRAGDSVGIDLESVAKELDAFAKNRSLDDNIIAFAKERAAKLRELKQYSPIEAQDRVTFLNNDLRAFDNKQSQIGPGRALVKKLERDNMRARVKKAVESVGETTYGINKSDYGSMLTVQGAISKEALKMQGKAPGLLDRIDMLSGALVADRLIKGDIIGASIVGVAKVGTKLSKVKNSSDSIVKKMFKKTSKSIDNTQPFEPKSATGKLLGRLKKKTGNVKDDIAQPIQPPIQKQLPEGQNLRIEHKPQGPQFGPEAQRQLPPGQGFQIMPEGTAEKIAGRTKLGAKSMRGRIVSEGINTPKAIPGGNLVDAPRAGFPVKRSLPERLNEAVGSTEPSFLKGQPEPTRIKAVIDHSVTQKVNQAKLAQANGKAGLARRLRAQARRERQRLKLVGGRAVR